MLKSYSGLIWRGNHRRVYLCKNPLNLPISFLHANWGVFGFLGYPDFAYASFDRIEKSVLSWISLFTIGTLTFGKMGTSPQNTKTRNNIMWSLETFACFGSPLSFVRGVLPKCPLKLLLCLLKHYTGVVVVFYSFQLLCRWTSNHFPGAGLPRLEPSNKTMQ